jgi:hypothetical protein
MELIAEADARFAVVNDHVAGEALAGRNLRLAQASEIRRGEGRRHLDLHARDLVRAALDHHVHLGAVPVPVVKEWARLLMPSGVASQFEQDESLEELPQKRSVRNAAASAPRSAQASPVSPT